MRKVKLVEISTIKNGSTPSTATPENYGGDIPWATPKDLSESGEKYFYFGERNITEIGAKSIGGVPIPENNLLLTSRAPIGLLSINKRETYTNQGFKNIVLDKEKADVEYMYYFLKQNIESLISLGGGTTFKEISKSTLEKLEFCLPPLPTQKAIANLLSTLDDKIELNRRMNKELESMVRDMYDYWFVGFNFPDEKGKPYKHAGGEMVYNEEWKREIPVGWKVANLINSSLHKVIKTGITKFDGRKSYFDTKRINESGISGTGEMVTYENKASRANMQPLKNSVWFAKMKDSVKHVFLTDREDEILNSIFSTGMFGIVCEKEGFEYLTSFIKFSDFEIVKNDLSHGATQQAVNNQDIEQIQFVVPDEGVLTRFSKLINPIFQKIQQNNTQSRQLAEVRDFLLPMLMNGQVEVVE